ncbi:hypothetical protein B0H66DRAFT_378523 [Apodospora peruviana]|uniref:Uncharacterized protein n=1 Tax=Apodospora peruviana TaxID=516989 RepID=A0AAE0LYS6_9PEZI|nr:hypothetical protein B0H66DRAFT_378523 [Apodospora peruviana]
MPDRATQHVDHNSLFTGPIREHVVNAKAATLILRGVISRGQPPPDSPSRNTRSRAGTYSSIQEKDASTDDTTTTATPSPPMVPPHRSNYPERPGPGASNEKLVTRRSQIPLPSNGHLRSANGHGRPRAATMGMTRVVTATGVGLGVKGRGLNSARFSAPAGRAASAGSVIGVRRKSSRFMMNQSQSEQQEQRSGYDDGIDENAPPPEALYANKKAKKR